MLFPGLNPVGYDPYAELRRLQRDMNGMFAGLGPAAEEFPPVNLWLGEDSVVVTAEIPGIRSDNLDVTVQDDTLRLAGRREPEAEGEDVAWHRRERGYGTFARAVQLPFRVDPDDVQARFLNGVLEIELRRPAEDRPRKIEIRSA